jgi:predicted anti-sigma-YlaC factor YlaD
MAGLRCRLLRRKLTEYLDGELAAKARAGVEKHLSTCRQCRKLLSYLREEYAAAEFVVRRPAPQDFADKVMARLQSEPSPRTKMLRPGSLPLRRMLWATATLAALLLLVGHFAGRPPGVPAETKTAKVGSAVALTSSELLELGTLQEENGQWEEALANYQAAADDNDKETRSDALLAAGRVYEKLGFPIAALEAFDKALSQQATPSPAARREKNENV